MNRRLEDYRRIVVKIGSALLVDKATGDIHWAWLESLAADVARLMKTGCEVLLVSSGAIALGRGRLGLPRRPLALEQSQAAASVGQIALARAYSEILGGHGFIAAQILLTLDDTEDRRRYLNARATLGTLIEATNKIMGMLGGIRIPSVPPAARSPRVNFFSYPRSIIAG